ncbi:MAG: glutamine--fructose-6-phosphate transaminase (isomerizing) [Candidatus Kaiserbacteria bacterium]|nr:glutamine--fructose-6-phosphate transaminase (isomerizing) [Candidatus Kaiserbacteria bacterium]
MCGIFGFTTENAKNAGEVLIDGLSSLEYRGYDSAGIFTPESGAVKAVGPASHLKRKMPAGFFGRSGIAHLRWATHGEPTEENAHPHTDCEGEVWLVHNGIVENFKELKTKLAAAGHTFASQTDTEIIAHLVEEHLKTEPDFAKAAIAAINEIRGTYGIAMQYRADPSKIVVARMGSPVVIGIGEHERFVASDPSPILRHTRDVVYLEDGEVAILTPESHEIYKLHGAPVERAAERIEWDAAAAQRGGYEHFMLKEIMEEADAVRNTSLGRLIEKEGMVKLGGLESVEEKLKQVKRIILVACGTASYAALAGEYMIEEHARIPVEVDIASEFRYRTPVINDDTAVVAVSQSGETLDTLEAIREGKRRGALTLGIVNAVGSTIARETDAGVYLHAGPEISVASTKAYVSQLTALALFTLFLGRQRGVSIEEGRVIAEALKALPERIEEIYKRTKDIQRIAKKYADARDFLFIGRKYNLATAFEGALKLKETSYVHAEGCGAGEMKHGHLAMIDEHFPTVAIAPSDSVYEKTASNIQEIRTRKGPVIAIATDGNEEIKELANDVMYIPKTIDMLTPILAVVPLHLFAYYFARQKGINVDRPRNLAKSVTVE